MAKEKKEIKEVYTSLDLIARGTYITAHSEFWDLFYKCFPELCDGTKIVNILYPDLNPCDDEIINFIYKDNSKYQYAMFFIDGCYT